MGNCFKRSPTGPQDVRDRGGKDERRGSRKSSLGNSEYNTSAGFVTIDARYRLEDDKAEAAWEKNGGKELEPVLASGAISLLSAQWLARVADDGGVLAARQAMEGLSDRQETIPDILFPPTCSNQDTRNSLLNVVKDQALDMPFLTLPELVAEVHETILRILCVSHCWLQPDHPDPRGHNLRHVARCVKLLVSDSFNGYAGHWGVFFDFCCLHQGCRDSNGVATIRSFEWLDSEKRWAHNAIGRDQAEEKLFREGMSYMGAFYSHPCTMVIMLSTFPENYDDLTMYNRSRKCESYFNRGWCFCESQWATMMKDRALVLDLGKDTGKKEGFFGLRAQCQGDRRPPMLPETFAEQMTEKLLTNPLTDTPRIQELYSASFADRFSDNTKLDYVRLSWANREAKSVAAVLKAGAVPHLRELLLGMNRIGDSGCAALAEAFNSGSTPVLVRLALGINRIGDGGVASLAEVFGSGVCPLLSQLWLQNNQIGDAGALALAEALPQIPSLTDLGLSGNANVKMTAKEILREAWGTRLSGGYGLEL